MGHDPASDLCAAQSRGKRKNELWLGLFFLFFCCHGISHDYTEKNVLCQTARCNRYGMGTAERNLRHKYSR